MIKKSIENFNGLARLPSNSIILLLTIVTCTALFISANFSRFTQRAPYLEITRGTASTSGHENSSPARLAVEARPAEKDVERVQQDHAPDKQEGNAVPVPLAEAAGAALVEHPGEATGGTGKEVSAPVSVSGTLGRQETNAGKDVQFDSTDLDAAQFPVRKQADDPEDLEEERGAEERGSHAAHGARLDLPVEGKHRCFFYDRPPRTGSTTMSRALITCLGNRKTGHGYVQPVGGPRQERALLGSKMLKLNNERIGLLGKHINMNATDAAGIRAKCANLFYVTSTKPMRERLWSYVKHRLTRGNNTMTAEVHRRAIQDVRKGMRNPEMYLESYPYVNPTDIPLDLKEEEKLVPDYVVRSERMAEDLGKLLEALQCETSFESMNRRSDVESTDFLNDVKLLMGDALYIRLTKLAEERNEDGLRKVRAFK